MRPRLLSSLAVVAAACLACFRPDPEPEPDPLPAACSEGVEPTIEARPLGWRADVGSGGGSQGSSTNHVDLPFTLSGLMGDDVVRMEVLLADGTVLTELERAAFRLPLTDEGDPCLRLPRATFESLEMPSGFATATVDVSRGGEPVAAAAADICIVWPGNDPDESCAVFTE